MTIPSPLRPCDCPCSHRRSCAADKARERTNVTYQLKDMKVTRGQPG
ncbi:unnamed protein product, partial [Ectocarpus sp. 13 AM-2016]